MTKKRESRPALEKARAEGVCGAPPVIVTCSGGTHCISCRWRTPRQAGWRPGPMTSPLVAIDPGKHRCGVALFAASGTLVAAANVPDPVAWAIEPRLCALAPLPRGYVLEVPQTYAYKRITRRGVESLEQRIAELEDRLGPAILATHRPGEWKGNVPKKAHHRRVEALLSPAEVAIFRAGDHNARDAVALGIFSLGRSGRGGAAPNKNTNM